MKIGLHLAFVAILVCATPAPHAQAQSKQDNSRSDIEKALASIANSQAEAIKQGEPGEYQRPCNPRQDNFNSDLCAQWKAARAAAESARWALWSFVLAVFGTIGLLATLFYTRRAVLTAEAANRDADTALEIARSNADAAAAHVKVAENTAEHQLRAYVAVRSVEFRESEDFDFDGTEIRLRVVNNGQTPGTITSVRLECSWLSEPTVVLLKVDTAVGHDCHHGTPIDIPFQLTGQVADASADEIGRLVVEGSLVYTDVFKNRHESRFLFTTKGGLTFDELRNPTQLNATVLPVRAGKSKADKPS